MTCQGCMFSPSACTSCYSWQNRYLVNQSCIPIPGYYEAGSFVAAPCISPCKYCFGTAINCTACFTNAYLNITASSALSPGLTPNFTCFPCTMFDFQCLTCNLTMCLTCTFSYIADIAGTCTTCTDYHSMCNGCKYKFYLLN